MSEEKLIVFKKPIFYRETLASPVLQILSFDTVQKIWNVQNVFKGCNSTPLKYISLEKLTTDITDYINDKENTEMTIELDDEFFTLMREYFLNNINYTRTSVLQPA